MKSLWISLVMAVVPFSLASAGGHTKVSSAEYYDFESWRGEYPNGYELYTDVRVATVTSPSNSKPGKDCELKAKSVIHPWAQKTQSQFLTQSPIIKLVAKKDFDLEEIKVKKGTEFVQLTYLAEGFCRFAVNGKRAEDACIESQDERAEVKGVSAFQVRELFKTKCANGTEAWIEARELQNLSEEKESPSVGPADIVEYGKVNEP